MGHLASGDTRVPIKDGRSELLESAIPKVTIVKDGNYMDVATVGLGGERVDRALQAAAHRGHAGRRRL